MYVCLHACGVRVHHVCAWVCEYHADRTASIGGRSVGSGRSDRPVARELLVLALELDGAGGGRWHCGEGLPRAHAHEGDRGHAGDHERHGEQLR